MATQPQKPATKTAPIAVEPQEITETEQVAAGGRSEDLNEDGPVNEEAHTIEEGLGTITPDYPADEQGDLLPTNERTPGGYPEIDNDESIIAEPATLPTGWIGVDEQDVGSMILTTNGLEIVGIGTLVSVLCPHGAASTFVKGTRLIASNYSSEANRHKASAALIRATNEAVAPCPWHALDSKNSVVSFAREIEQFGVLVLLTTEVGSTLTYVSNTRISVSETETEGVPMASVVAY